MEAAAKKMNCKLWEVDERPLEEKLAALAACRVSEKVRPSLEAIAEQRARRRAKAKEILADSKE